MENGYESLRKRKSCAKDIRFMWLLAGRTAAVFHMTIDNFMNNVLNGKIEEIFADITLYYLNKKT